MVSRLDKHYREDATYLQKTNTLISSLVAHNLVLPDMTEDAPPYSSEFRTEYLLTALMAWAGTVAGSQPLHGGMGESGQPGSLPDIRRRKTPGGKNAWQRKICNSPKLMTQKPVCYDLIMGSRESYSMEVEEDIRRHFHPLV